MSMIVDRRDYVNSCCYSETGFHKFEPYDTELSKILKVDELIRDLEKLIDDIKEWRAFQK